MAYDSNEHRSFVKNNDKMNKITRDLNARLGAELSDLEKVYDIQAELLSKKQKLLYALTSPESDIMVRLSAALKKAEDSKETIKENLEKSRECKQRITHFLHKTQPLQNKLRDTLSKISKLEHILEYLRSLEAVDSLNAELKKSKDLEQSVLSFMELKDMCSIYKEGHRAQYLRETTHYWYNILKDRLSKEYDDVIRLIHWPFTSSNITLTSTPSTDTLAKFSYLTQLLMQIQLPNESNEYQHMTESPTKERFSDMDVCLPIRLLLRPLKRRFAFHFTGNRKTARLDRPEWFLTQTLTWIRDHVGFVRNNIQPIADKLEMFHINAELEFTLSLVGLAAERLHHTLTSAELDSAMAHAVDEALGFERELRLSNQLIGHINTSTGPSVLAVLTQAPVFIRWLAVEKKYALLKMDETLSNQIWMEPVVSSNNFLDEATVAGDSSIVWVPRGADWFICVLQTIQDRYSVLPQPGHRLQFLELQRDLIEEWRVRLNQLLSAALSTNLTGVKVGLIEPGDADSGILGGPVAAVINAAHHTRTVLLEWAYSVHYLQLYYYEEQFRQFTDLQHKHETEFVESETSRIETSQKDSDETPSLLDVEAAALEKAEAVTSGHSKTSATRDRSLAGLDIIEDDNEDSGVFGDAPALLMRLCDAGIAALCETILMDFKAATRDYRNEKWHSMPIKKNDRLSKGEVTASLCVGLGHLCSQLLGSAPLPAPAPILAAMLARCLASEIDNYLWEDLVMESWWSLGGGQQFNFDITRNLMPVFTTFTSTPDKYFPKLKEACILLTAATGTAMLLQENLSRPSGSTSDAEDMLAELGIRRVSKHSVLKLLRQRTDLSGSSAPLNTPKFLLDLF